MVRPAAAPVVRMLEGCDRTGAHDRSDALACYISAQQAVPHACGASTYRPGAVSCWVQPCSRPGMLLSWLLLSWQRGRGQRGGRTTAWTRRTKAWRPGCLRRRRRCRGWQRCACCAARCLGPWRRWRRRQSCIWSGGRRLAGARGSRTCCRSCTTTASRSPSPACSSCRSCASTTACWQAPCRWHPASPSWSCAATGQRTRR